jgi:hypothetical protein
MNVLLKKKLSKLAFIIELELRVVSTFEKVTFVYISLH